MLVHNLHERLLAAGPVHVGTLIDRLASEDEVLWPRDRWPPMKFDRGLVEGAAGGHGPVRYSIESYEPGRKICFRFSAPRGFFGVHGFEVEEVAPDRARLRHFLRMRAEGRALVTWPVVFRPLHDALIEDALDNAESHLGGTPPERRWSPWVRILRRALARRRAGTTPGGRPA